jgi:hypothetical protein
MFLMIFGIYFIITYLTRGDYVCVIENFDTDIMYRVFVILLFLIFLAIVIYDLGLQFWMMYKFDKTLKQVFTEDIYLFRFENIFFGLLIVLPYHMVMFGLEQTVFSDKNLEFGRNYFNYCILMSVEYHLLFVMNCGFVLVYTMGRSVLNCCKKKVETNTLLDDLKDEQFYKLFREYLEQEFSQENLICFLDIQKYKNERNQELLTPMAKELFHNYLNGAESALEVNVDGPTRTAIHDKLFSMEPLSLDLFDGVERVLKTNLYDSFSRFANTNPYIIWKDRKEEMKGLMQGDSLGDTVKSFRNSMRGSIK